jgi:hypothetical protein
MKHYIKLVFLALVFIGFTGCGSSDSTSGSGTTATNQYVDVDAYPMSTLNNDTKYTIAYMWNEEKLAKDIYLALYNIYPNAQQLYNIATNSETQHEAMVQDLVQKYDLNITNIIDYEQYYSEAELAALAPGEYALDAIQSLYNTLYEKGVQTEVDALQVGCMVEVTDVNDLNHDIEVAQASGATDVVAVFESLRKGSYNHYWSFDSALKNLGIADGCASLGAEYAKTPEEYPQTSGGGNGGGHGKGRR